MVHRSGISAVRTPDQRYPAWLTTYQLQLTSCYPEHNISGDVLCMLDPETLKAVGVATVGQRLAILKAIYQAKLAYHIPIDSDHYVPPCMSISPTSLLILSHVLQPKLRNVPCLSRNSMTSSGSRVGASRSVILSLSSSPPEFIAQRVSHLEDDNKRLKETVEVLLEEFTQVRNSQRSGRAVY